MQRGQDYTRTGWTHFKHGGVTRTRAPLVDQYRTSIARCLMSVLELLRGCLVIVKKFIRNATSLQRETFRADKRGGN